MTPKQLSAREIVILTMYADGSVGTEIAAELGVTKSTFRGIVCMIFKKLHAKTITHAVALAYHNGILVPRRDN